jgi:hypothetical protein
MIVMMTPGLSVWIPEGLASLIPCWSLVVDSHYAQRDHSVTVRCKAVDAFNQSQP